MDSAVFTFFGNLGVSGIFIWLYIQEKRSNKEKDEYLKELNSKVLEAFNLNTKVSEQTNNILSNNQSVMTGLVARMDKFYFRTRSGRNINDKSVA
jgi:hypothetical protein